MTFAAGSLRELEQLSQRRLDVYDDTKSTLHHAGIVEQTCYRLHELLWASELEIRNEGGCHERHGCTLSAYLDESLDSDSPSQPRSLSGAAAGGPAAAMGGKSGSSSGGACRRSRTRPARCPVRHPSSRFINRTGVLA